LNSPPATTTRRTVLGATLLLYVSAQFFVLTLAAMAVFPGGTFHHPEATHYEFTRNFFSDLGATRTFSGRSNWVSEILFTVALGSIGLGLVASAGIWKSIGRQAAAFGTLAQSFAILAGLCFVGIAATPWNVLGSPHMFFVKLGFSLLLGLMSSMVILQVRNGWPVAYIAGNGAYIVVLAVYVWILFYGPSVRTDAGLEFQVVAQKIIVYASILNLAAQAYGLHRGALDGRPSRGRVEIVNAC
jgi:hypothetical protein